MRETLGAASLWLVTAARSAPVLLVGAFVGGLGTAVQGPIQALGVKLTVDGIALHEPQSLAWAALIFAGWILFAFGVGLLTGAVQDTLIDRVHDYVHVDLIRTIAGIPSITHHERPEIADQIELVHGQSRVLAQNVRVLLSIVFALVNAGIIVFLLASVHPILVGLPLVGLARIWASHSGGRIRFEALDRTIPYRRVAERLSRIAKTPSHGVEVRAFGLQAFIVGHLQELLGRVRDERLRATRRGVYRELLARPVFSVALLVAIVFVASRTIQGDTTPGDLALLVVLGSRVDQAAGQISAAMGNVGETIRLFGKYLSLKRYAEASASNSSTLPAPSSLSTGIRLEDVTFSYPGSSSPVLRNVSVDFPAGKSIAIVGENGAGKSTLVKLLARLYDPTQGRIFVDDNDVRDFCPSSWSQRSTAAFQDFVKYEFDAGTAVGLGDLSCLDNLEAIQSALVSGDAVSVVNDLPEGCRTQLGKRFGEGIELSGGQWQRLALARSFMRTTPQRRSRPVLMIFDEPTASLDPEAEHQLYERIAAESADSARGTGAVTVLVSHRFSTVRMADLIVVLRDGQIDDVGPHEELIKHGGHYAELFELQARAYR